MPQQDSERASRATRWHQSGLAQIAGCPRQWALEHVVGLPQPQKVTAAAGTAYHAAVEAHERARMAGHPDGIDREQMLVAGQLVLDQLVDGMDPGQLAGVKLAQPAPRKKRGEDKAEPTYWVGAEVLAHELECAIEAFWDAPCDESGRSVRDVLLTFTPLALEQFVSGVVVPGARELGGSIDGIYWDPTTERVLLVDHKTSSRLGDWRRDGKGSDQATHYSALVAVDENLAAVSDRLPVTGYLPEMWFAVVTRQRPARETTSRALMRPVQPLDIDVVALGQRVAEAEETIALGLFPANPEYEWCRSCPFRRGCLETGELMAPITELLVRVSDGPQSLKDRP
jgi:hypothetical protein